MALDQPAIQNEGPSPDSASPQSPLRRFLAGWRRLEEAMDYGPLDYTNDRLRGLEVRIEQLEKRLAALPNVTGLPNSSPTLLITP